MAFFFLIFTVTDLSFPPCLETPEIANGSVQAVSGGVTDNSEAVEANESRSDQSHEKRCGDEDCCFACAHGLSAIAVTEVGVFDLKSTHVTMANRFVPEPPLRSTYHPPRFA